MASNWQETPSQPNAEKKCPTGAKLLQAAALAAMLVPLGSVAAESSTITCTYAVEGGGSGCSDSTSSSNTFNFVDYKYILEFFDGSGVPYSGDPFAITITDVLIDPSFEAEFSPFFSESLEGDYECLLISLDRSHCVEFQISQSSGPDSPWASYTMTIAWNAPTPTNGSPGIPRVLERESLVAGDEFDLDMCFAVPCVFTPGLFDPAISSGDEDFSTQIPVVLQSPIPEPATLLLVGSGLGAILYRRRRRRLDSAASGTS